MLLVAEEGGGTSTVPFFSSQEWSQTTVDSSTVYLGRWGLTVHSYNPTTGQNVNALMLCVYETHNCILCVFTACALYLVVQHCSLFSFLCDSNSLLFSRQYDGNFIIIGGSFTGGGAYDNSVYESLDGMFCDVQGVICGGV